MSVGEIRYITYDKGQDGVLILDVVILLDEPNTQNNKRLVLGHTEYESFSHCLWKTLDYALAEYPRIQWYRFLSDDSDVKRANHKWKHYEQDNQTKTI